MSHESSPVFAEKETAETKADMSATTEEEQKEVHTLAGSERLTAASRLMALPHLTEVCC